MIYLSIAIVLFGFLIDNGLSNVAQGLSNIAVAMLAGKGLINAPNVKDNDGV